MGKALVIKGADFSSVAVDTIEINVESPIISITTAGVVTIIGPTGATIYYTTNGDTPTSSSTEYTAPFNVINGVVVKAIACITVGGSTKSSAVVSETAVVEGMTLNKKFATGVSGINPSDAEGYCVSPYIDIFDGDENVSTTDCIVIWNWGTVPSGTSMRFISTADKITKSDSWDNSGNGTRTFDGSSQNGLKRYCRASFYMGVAGSITIKHSGTTVAVWEYNGGLTAETATWTRTT